LRTRCGRSPEPSLPDEPHEEERAAREQAAADRHERGEPERAG
jgi:hypothetical protein